MSVLFALEMTQEAPDDFTVEVGFLALGLVIMMAIFIALCVAASDVLEREHED